MPMDDARQLSDLYVYRSRVGSRRSDEESEGEDNEGIMPLEEFDYEDSDIVPPSVTTDKKQKVT